MAGMDRAIALTIALRKARLDAGHSQADLALVAGVSPESIGRAERTGRLSPAMAARLAKALGVPAAVLLGSAGRTRPTARGRAS